MTLADSAVPDPSLEDQLDAVVAGYADALAAGRRVDRDRLLANVPPQARPGLERALKMIDAGSARPPSGSSPLAPGLSLGGTRYRLEREVGRGGMSLVWLAHDSDLRRPVALKILRPGLALEARHVDRFRREALAIARIQHPHIVQIHGVGEDHGYHWLAMEFVEGPSLASVLAALPTDRPRTAAMLALAARAPVLHAFASYERALAALLAPVVDALAQAHGLGLVHRDVKPSNILLHADGRAVIADFGLAKGDDDPALSLTGEGLGTPYYMSPEQAHLVGAGRVDQRTDVYSFGVSLYEALTGSRPFRGETFFDVLEAIRTTVPPSIRLLAPGCSTDAAAVVRRAMARDPADRYADAAELHADLIALRDGVPTSASRHEGGMLRRLARVARIVARGQLYEYRSVRTLFGLPLVHLALGRRAPGTPPRKARGWLAMGDVAVGVVACGGQAYGGLAIGGVAAGLVSWGGLAAGIVSTGGMAIGALTFAGLGLGWFAVGGVAVGHAAVGGLPVGHYAMGGLPIGNKIVSGQHVDIEAERYFDALFESFGGFFVTLFGL